MELLFTIPVSTPVGARCDILVDNNVVETRVIEAADVGQRTSFALREPCNKMEVELRLVAAGRAPSPRSAMINVMVLSKLRCRLATVATVLRGACLPPPRSLIEHVLACLTSLATAEKGVEAHLTKSELNTWYKAKKPPAPRPHGAGAGARSLGAGAEVHSHAAAPAGASAGSGSWMWSRQ